MLFGTKSVDSKAEKRAFFSNKINGSRGLEGSDPTGPVMAFPYWSMDVKNFTVWLSTVCLE
jgi:hypothetical protein